MAQKKTKAQKAADKAFIDKIKPVGLNLGSGGVKVDESDGPPVCDGCGSELVPDGDPIGFMALPMKGKLAMGPVYKAGHKKHERPAEEQSFSA